MPLAKALIIGALVLTAFAAVTAAVVALAPYIAVAGIAVCVGYYIWTQSKEDTK